MKIVVFGPKRRLGALAGDRVIDLNRGFARYLQERGDRYPNEQAAKRLPFVKNGNGLRSCEQFIEIIHGVDGYCRRAIEHYAEVEFGGCRYVGKI